MSSRSLRGAVASRFSSSYRLQLRSGVRLADATKLVRYLSDLGVSTLYLSPVLKARPGSEHGYDVVDPLAIDPELGTERDLIELVDELRTHHMSLLLDIVPNHMGIHASNRWWWDVLKHGKSARHAHFFDIDWELGDGKLLLPILGSDLEQALEQGELAVIREREEFVLGYYDLRLPLTGAEASLLGAVESVVELRELLDAQPYRLCRWNTSLPQNYRRFFNINDLVGLRVEEPEVFDATHELIIDWVRRRLVDGLRIDHPDGLLDPEGYLARLVTKARRAMNGDASDEALPIYLVIEKILGADEQLPPKWPIHGTTGYEQLNLINAMFVDRGSERRLREFCERFTGRVERFSEVVHKSTLLVLDSLLGPELEALTRLIHKLAADMGEPDLDRDDIKRALREIVAYFPVYRSYVSPDAERVEGQDRSFIERAFAATERAVHEVPPAAFACLRAVLLLEVSPALLARARQALLRFQQLTGPALAKGVEDTALYRYAVLISLNDVGGDPERFGISVDEFHALNQRRARSWPLAMTATSTHDTKRSEDVRVRIDLLSEIPELWIDHAERWRELNARHKTLIEGVRAPDPNDEYLLYQTLLGATPARVLELEEWKQFVQRVQDYMRKAIREEKRKTRWIKQNSAYEEAVADFVAKVLNREESHSFLRSLVSLVARLSRPALFGSLSQLTIKLGCPGIPDIYQGTELWDDSLVDPDNRRPVDFDQRRRMLRTLLDQAPHIDELAASIEDGRLKLWATHRALWLRRRRAEFFERAVYLPLIAQGPRADQVVAFARVLGDDAVIVAVGRFFTRFHDLEPVGQAWAETMIEAVLELPAGRYADVYTGLELEVEAAAPVALERLFARLPAAMLERVP